MPGLAVVIVGQRKDSQSYVNMKRKSCFEVGIKSFDIDLPEDVSETELISKVHQLNANPDVHGWLLFILYLNLFSALRNLINSQIGSHFHWKLHIKMIH